MSSHRPATAETILEADIRELVQMLRAANHKWGPEELSRLCGRAAEQIVWLYHLQASFRAGFQIADYLQKHAIPATQCNVCGIKFDGAMSYCCPHPECPTAARAT